MTRKHYYVTGLLLTAAILLVTIAVYPQLPDQIPRRWDFDGNVHVYHTPKRDLFVSGPGLMAGFLLLGWILSRLPRKQRPGVKPLDKNSTGIFFVVQLGLLGLLAYIHILVLAGALGDPVNMARATGLGISLFLLLQGNVMGKVRRNVWFGIQTRWTLSDERVWNATQRVAGKTIFTAGILGLVFYALGAAILLTVLFWAAFVAAFAIPHVYSWRLAKRLAQHRQI